MNTDIRIAVSFKGHRKRRRLRLMLGDNSTDYLLDLWISTAMNHPSGVLEGMDIIDIALEAGWEKDPKRFVDALLACGFLELGADGQTYALHDWADHQGYVIHADARRAKAKKAAEKRWNATSDAPSIESDAPSTASDATSIAPSIASDATSIAPSMNFDAPTPTPAPVPTPIPTPAPIPPSTEQKTGVLERIEAHTAPADRNAPPSADATPPGQPQSAGPKKTAARATRLPPDFTVPPDWLAWAAQVRPGLDVSLEAEKFCDYWKAASGRNATKHDWQATWRNWIRNAHPPRTPSGRALGKPLTVTEHNAAALQEWLAMKEREVAEAGHAAH